MHPVFFKLLSKGAGMRIVLNIPATASSPGLKGDVAFDIGNGWVYFCYALNKWARASISAF